MMYRSFITGSHQVLWKWERPARPRTFFPHALRVQDDVSSQELSQFNESQDRRVSSPILQAESSLGFPGACKKANSSGGSKIVEKHKSGKLFYTPWEYFKPI